MSSDPRQALDLRPIINVSGTMTGLGASIMVPEAIRAMALIAPQFVEIDQLQRRASVAIARLTGAEAGFVTASSAAGISLATAATIAGDDLLAIERLPEATTERCQVLIQAGHLVGYGAPVEQAVRLGGGRPVAIGQATGVQPYQLEGAITGRTAALLHVVSHHTVPYGMLPLEEAAAIAHARGVPVIVDAASEYDLRGFLAQGADLVLYSGHKFLGGPTSGIVAGSRDLVRRAYLQNRGIGRGMKVGKESIAGLIAALDAWARRDHAAIRAREETHLALWHRTLRDRPGVRAEILPDPTGNPLCRLRLHLDPERARITAWDLADALARGTPPVITRDGEVEQGWLELDPCNLHPGEAEIVARRLVDELEAARGADDTVTTPLATRRRRRIEALRHWPD